MPESRSGPIQARNDFVSVGTEEAKKRLGESTRPDMLCLTALT
jgi:hypothetical protein